MDSILSTIAPLVFEYSIGPIARHVSYPFNYKSNVTSLEERVKELKSARDNRQCWVDELERNGKVIDQDVLDWLKDVSGFIEEQEAELVLADEKTKKKCCLGFCPNLKTRYQVSKKAEQKAGVVVSFSEKNGTFSTHYHTPALQWTGGFSSKDFEALESRMSILNDIMNALTSADVNTIGVHGVGGVGKTTLAREVRRKAREEKLFDEVVMVTVTVDVDGINIQKTIADFLGLKFNEESKEGRAARLCERLKQEKREKKEKILIILDDLWKKLKLEEVGIPQPDEHNGCKLLLTSRHSDVLSNEMGSQKDFPISALEEDEAWDLFKKIANSSSFDDPDLQCIAKDVSKVCAGLPIAIVTVASSLKSKSLPEWSNALNELNAIPSIGLTEMLAKLYYPIEFSYNKLESKELQSTFLLCCQMGFNATIRDLLKYGIGLGLFDFRTLENAQDKVYSLVRKLKTRCLLLEGNSNRQLVMHDLVRDVGRWIASRDHGVVVVDDRNNPKEWADEEKIKTYRSIWLYNNAEELQEGLQCPNLDFIHIDGNDGDLQLPDNLFTGLYQLRVLSLTSFHFSSLPSSVGLLKNLSVFCNLEELALDGYRDSIIWGNDFPANLFSTLKVLTLYYLGEDNWRGIPVSLLQEFHNLEKLNVRWSDFEELFSFDGSVAADVVEDHYNCPESLLPRLKHLDLSFLDAMRYICEQQNHVFHLSQLFRSLETLKVEYCDSLVSVAPSSTVSFQNLTSLILSRCHKLVNIVTATTAKSLSNLVTLEEDPIQNRSLSTPMDIRSISQAQMDDCSTDQNKTIPPSSTEQSVNVCERPASDSRKDHFSKPVFKGLLPEHKMTQIPSTYQHSRAIAEYDQEDPSLNQSSSTAMEMGNCFVSQEQELSDAIPTPYAAPKPAIVSTSESKNRTLSSLELTSSLFSNPSSKPPSFPITEIESMNHATSSKKPPNITPSSFQPALSLITPAESCNSILETDGYSMSMHVMKNLLSKPLTEVASSTDRVLLLSTLKNLRKCQCHLLNAQQIETIQVFIENFDSFVAYHPFHENQIEQVGAFKLCVEDKKKGMTMLKNHYEDLAQKSTSLAADKEALIKRLGEIEEEEDKIREDMEDVRAKIATDSGTLEEAYTFFVPEFDREQKEAEAKVCTSNSQWAKMRSLFT